MVNLLIEISAHTRPFLPTTSKNCNFNELRFFCLVISFLPLFCSNSLLKPKHYLYSRILLYKDSYIDERPREKVHDNDL